MLYNADGEVVAIDQGAGAYGTDWILEFVPWESGPFYISASWDQGQAPAHRYVSVGVYEDLDTVTLPEGVVPLEDYGTDGIDVVSFGRPWSKTFFFFDGQDVTLNYRARPVKYIDVERFVFKDVAVAVDLDGNAGMAYRIYEAVFNRAPDKGGLGYWIHQLDSGASLHSVAGAFLASDEFQQTYGSELSNEAFVSEVYENVLDRAPDPSGLDYWVRTLDDGALDRAGVLLNFSESQENRLAVLPSIENGIFYDPWV